MYYSNVTVKKNQGNIQQVLEAILAGIKRGATAIDFYNRLLKSAPKQKHKNYILQALEDEKFHLNLFTELYIKLTGRRPMYEIDKVTFNSYREGLQKAYEIAVKDYEEYRNSYLLTQRSPFQDVFWRACNNKANHANRFSSLSSYQEGSIKLKDYGKKPFVVNINKAAKQNNTFRTAIWTGDHLQVTVMSINVGDDIGLEVHPTVDQFLRIEEGQGLVQMGDRKDQLDFKAKVYDDYAIMVPAGKWHNLINTGDKPLKLYTIYAPPEHPFGTVHKTKADALV
ncbi:cupin domain-containing protein [Thermoflavimicrobium daqui]|jgi:mannose-6-phosphate isomerase-like protein (cupin superfamily)|uniref:Cupin domain-containing protein n=2 Tax=Thermoflavimicrobium daqui TaxID=2137476 RepID=A0A364K2S3_9BACL|nr:cupin domain-containing protein [Thermoflavimicrobium daqui]